MYSIFINNMSEWNKNTEQLVVKIGEECKRRRRHHLEYADKSGTYHTLLSGLAILLGPTTAVIAGSVKTACTENTAVVALSVASGIVASVIKFGKFDEMHHLHKQASSSYHMLETNTELQLTRKPENRENPDTYIKWVHAKYEEIFTSSPLITLHDVSSVISPSEATSSQEGPSSDTSFDLESLTIGRDYMTSIVNYEMQRFEKHGST